MWFEAYYGNVVIDGLAVSKITGLYGDLNQNTLRLPDGYYLYGVGYALNLTFYSSVPVITASGGNIIKSFTINDASLDDSVFFYDQSNYAGMFAHFPYDISLNTLSVESLTISKFSSRNVYNYGSGSLIHRYGNFTLDDANVTEYGVTWPEAHEKVTTVPAIVSILRPDHAVTLTNLGFFNGNGGSEGSSLLILSDTTQSVTASPGPHLTLNTMSITSSTGTSSILKFNLPSLVAKVTGINARENVGIGVSVISIAGGGEIDFIDLDMYGNQGTTTADISINSCPICNVRVINSTFSRDVVDTSGTPTFNKVRSIEATSGGDFQIINSTMSNFLLVEEGGVMKFSEMEVTCENSNFTNNMAQRGGVLSLTSKVTFTLKNSRFTNNFASERAGAIYGTGEVTLSTEDCTFSGNQAPEDAVFYLELNILYNDKNSVFEQNTASQSNSIGSIIQGSGPGVLEGTSFLNNTVTGSGGVLLYLLFKEITFKNGFLRDNVFNGGNKNINAISSTVNFENFTFSNDDISSEGDETTEGGFANLFLCVSSITNSSFTNGAAKDGGAIYAFSSSMVTSGNTFTNCRAKSGGGAVFSYSISTYKSTGDTYIDNKAGSGDGIGMILVNDIFELENGSFQTSFPSQFIDSSESTLLIKNNTFEQTSNYMTTNTSLTRDGSGVWIDSTTKFTAQNNTFKNLRTASGTIAIEDHVNGQDVDDIFGDTKAPGEILVGLQDNEFDGCRSFGTEGGAGVFYD